MDSSYFHGGQLTNQNKPNNHTVSLYMKTFRSRGQTTDSERSVGFDCVDVKEAKRQGQTERGVERGIDRERERGGERRESTQIKAFLGFAQFCDAGSWIYS